ncbi:hypothetical protein HK097_011155, partial [Rhizophlyctis rosea]
MPRNKSSSKDKDGGGGNGEDTVEGEAADAGGNGTQLTLSKKSSSKPTKVSKKDKEKEKADKDKRNVTPPPSSPQRQNSQAAVPFYAVSEVPMPPVEEVETMLELLMEDLNLTEDKKSVLRRLPDSRKWIMLQQHLGERYRDNTSHSIQAEIQEIHRLRDSPDKDLLTNLVVSLRSRPIRWISTFIDNGGLGVLLGNLEGLEGERV